MKDKSQIEAALERSLRRQVSVPRLDRRFDAGVWARIEAAEVRNSAPMIREADAPATARWLYAINVAGLASVAIFLAAMGWQMLPGLNIGESLPAISAAMSERVLMSASTIIAAVAVAFGLMFTPWGRRLRDEFG
ncbi:MAG TPA: hypothetical protein VIV63_11980 [Steroidobacteraceae bacterium]